MAKLMTRDRGGKVLVLEEFRYHRHRTNQQNIRWGCWRENCRAVLRTNIFDVDFRQEVIGEVEREPKVPIRRVYNDRRVALQRQRTLQGGGD